MIVHEDRALASMRGMPPRAAEADPLMRRTPMLAFCASLLLTGLAACKEPVASSGSDSIRAAGDIVVASVARYQASDTSAESGAVYLVCTFSYTNKLGREFAPRIEKFTLEDAAHRRFGGEEGGSAELVGISNDRSVLGIDQTRRYTAGFRVPQNFAGILYYDPT
jgi:hypothetical protein